MQTSDQYLRWRLSEVVGQPLLARESSDASGGDRSSLKNSSIVGKAIREPYYPMFVASHRLRLNYYYDRSGRWVKFSDWIPKSQRQYRPMFLEDYYELVGLAPAYQIPELKENIFFLLAGLNSRFRHPARALAKIETEEQYAKYRSLLFMQLNLRIMRMHLRLGAKYDKQNLYFYDTDFSDNLEKFFFIARSYYYQAYPFWQRTKKYAGQAMGYRSQIDLPALQSTMYRIHTGEIDFDRIIARHIGRVEAKLEFTNRFLDQEGRPRPVKQAIEKELQEISKAMPTDLQ